jgi:FAD/FMN-containing dehydrogenase
VKGGGHGTNPKMSSTQDGIQIYMGRFKDVKYDPNTQRVKVGAGCLWDHVYLELAKEGRSVVGGARNGGVGVAGFLQGGGYSIKTNQYGLGIDNIYAIDVVLPRISQQTGKIEVKRVAKDSNLWEDVELFQALKVVYRFFPNGLRLVLLYF